MPADVHLKSELRGAENQSRLKPYLSYELSHFHRYFLSPLSPSTPCLSAPEAHFEDRGENLALFSCASYTLT